MRNYENELEQIPIMVKIKSKKWKSTSLKLKKKHSGTSSSTSIYKKKKQLEELSEEVDTTTEEKKLFNFKPSSHLIKKKTFEETFENAPTPKNKPFIGPLTLSERMEKVMKYLQKKRMKSQMKKFCYKCRKQVAEKRLRIKGRFVTKQQAFDILGMTSDELKNNEIIQKLLEQSANADVLLPKLQLNSLVESENGKK